MACTRPLKAYRAPGGKISFASKDAYEDRKLELACGQCKHCRLKRTREWGIRCLHEAQMSESSAFVTLTYDDAHLPEDLSVDVRDWQLFAKRLRKRMGPFRFLHCGEYGDAMRRPHYHAVLFGVDFHDAQFYKMSSGKPLWTSKILEETWGKGFAPFGSVEFDSACYVAAYTMKRASGELAESRYRRESGGRTWKVRPDYATMSRRPGLGTSWFEKYVDEVYPEDSVVANGRKFRPPAFYDRLLEEQRPTLFRKVMANRRRRVMESAPDREPDRLRASEKVLDARLALRRDPDEV